ncbi:hypothetical protein DL764_005339 [Monosporascus ibericus]|uniref:FAD-binding PCMH-type domain-containing protein n=1 Tax=Monosporascus ibericus TaxID=155417 RepID=A0A4Q4TCW2_9PEZI|nr:hypothetical protein DL764_005339 [Monosporascus ibericus]
MLSSKAQAYFPGSDGFAAATARWSALTCAPQVLTTAWVKYANEKKRPFLAVSGGHGAITTVGQMRDGIEIWMNQLSSVNIAEDGTTAKIGGGTLSKTVTDTILGPGLGGGHGFLQGRYGLISDQFVSMNIVLADGSMQTIDGSSDLWWAMQGAGHNFGIVTSVTSKIYDIQHSAWAYESFVFTGDRVEALYEGINEHLLKNGTQPVGIINYSFFISVPDIDPAKPVIMFFILQEGMKSVDPSYTNYFHELGPVVTDSAGGSYTDLPAWTGNANTSPPCQKAGLVNVRFPIDIEMYNIRAQRRVYDLFASAIGETPALNNSLFLFEGYSLQGVKAVPNESAAFPFRGDNLLVSPLIIYAPGGPDLDKKAADLGENLRQFLHEGSGRKELHTYVNYAFGLETQRNWYGHEQWRQERLLKLKDKYDPQRKFSFYAPIA